jgi:hypothetical protein
LVGEEVMNHISAEQLGILVDKIISLKSSAIATERSDYNNKKLAKIQGNFGSSQIIQIAYGGGEHMKVIIRTQSRGGLERIIKLPDSGLFRMFNPYYRQWKRLHKNIRNRLDNKEMEEAQNGMAEVSDAIVTLFPEIAEKYLLGDK